MTTTTDEFLEEWKQWIERLSTRSLYFRDDFVAAASAMESRTMSELASFYNKILAEDQMDRINKLLSSNTGIVPMSAIETGIRNLVRLFAHLGQLEHAPFSSQAVKIDVEATPDWNKLPHDLQFLAEPALEASAKYPYVWSEAGYEQVATGATQDQREHFRPVADKVRAIGADRVKDWYKRMGLFEHVEASIVMDLIGVLDALDLPYYADKVIEKARSTKVTDPNEKRGTCD